MTRPLVYAGLAGGILVVSTAAILIRMAQAEGVPSLAIAALRLGIASAVMIPFARVHARAEWRALRPRDVRLAWISGTCLAIHFGAWITSLEYTSVASSTALVTTNPIWVGIGSMVLLRERLSSGTVAGIAFALAGTMVLLWTDATASGGSRGDSILGNALALIGALSASAYLLIGRALRDRLALLSYVAMAYGVAALILLLAAVANGDALLGHSAIAYVWIAALAIGPQLIGHTILNWSVRHLPATLVALSILGEPIGSSLLATFFLNESVSALQLLAFVVILAGIFFAARDGRSD